MPRVGVYKTLEKAIEAAAAEACAMNEARLVHTHWNWAVNEGWTTSQDNQFNRDKVRSRDERRLKRTLYVVSVRDITATADS